MVGYNQVFPTIQAPNVANTLLQIRQLENQDQDRQYRNALLNIQTKAAQQKLDDRNALRTALPGAMNGDAAASSEVAAINPDLWMKLDANRREKVKRDVDLTGRLLYAVEQSPDKPTAYQAAIAAAKEQGVDVSKAPPQYDAGWVQSRMAEALSVADQIKMAEGSTKVLAPGGRLVNSRTGATVAEAPDRTQAPVAVPDDKSPTGFRYVTREDALGQPALGPSGMSVDFDPTTGKVSGIRSGPGAAKGGGALPNSAQSKATEAVMDGQQTIDRLDYIKSLYEPDFLTYGGKLSAAGSDVLNKLNPEQRSQFTTRMRTFQSQSQQYFLAYKKWATGQAAGEKEMAQIEASIPNTSDSPQAWEAKVEATKQIARKIMVRNQIALKEGVQPGTTAYKDWAQAHPLEGIPSLQERGDQLHGQGYKPEQVIQILKQEGYR